ncbi:MAG TPA: lycopene cyclase, partial [Polyangiaceae bacterium]|nr:lycopene cyclase [Polyangiaceae bacterium]
GARLDFDVLLAGGGLSLVYAPMLAAMGLRVAVADRARAGAAHREWNASRGELEQLTVAGLATAREIDEELVVARYRHGICRWHGGGTHRVRGVLDHAVDASRLLGRARSLAESRGVTILDHTTVTAHASGRSAVSVRLAERGGVTRDVVASVLVDARGASSPFASADLVCPTVGGVMEGLDVGGAPDEIDPEVGEILVTTEGVEGGRQHLWEAFPGRAGEVTVYLFHYAKRDACAPGELLRLYARFFERLGRYKRGADAKLVRPTFGVIPGWSRLVPAPRAPEGRVVLVGDAASRHSPLTFCGFGATLRSLVRASRLIADAVESPGASPPTIVDDRALHRGTGALALLLACASDARRPDELNRLLDAAFEALAALGQEAFAALLRDEMALGDFLEFLRGTARRRPAVYSEVLARLGPWNTVRWGTSLARAAVGR